MGGKNDGQKVIVVDNAKLFVSNRQLLGTESPGSHNTKTRNNEDEAADPSDYDPAG